MGKIVSKADVWMIVLQLKEPFRFVYGTFFEIPRVLLRIEVESDSATYIGWGEAAIDFPFVPYDMFDIYDALSEAARRISGINLESVSHVLRSTPLEFLKAIPAAQCALNMALDDVVSRSEGVGAVRLYSANRAAGVPLCSVGFDQLQSPAVWSTLPGVIKLKAGQNLQSDLANIRAAQTLANKTQKQYAVDFNAAYNLEEVFALVDGLRTNAWTSESCIAWEQPLHADATLNDWKRLIDKLTTFPVPPTLIADESFISANAGQQLVDCGVGLNYKIQKLGGICAVLDLEEAITRAAVKSFVGGTFPSPLGRAYDTLAGQVITSATLPGDGFLPASTYLSDACMAAFAVSSDGVGLGVQPVADVLTRWIVADPKEEFYRIRTDHAPRQIKMVINGSYAERYQERCGRTPLWNMT